MLRKYSDWRDARQERHVSFVVSLAVTAFSLVVLPGQWIPVLFADELDVVGLSLVSLGVGSAVATAGAARRAERSVGQWLIIPAAVANALTLSAIAFYRAVGGIGWPDWHELALGPIFVLAATLVGVAVSRVRARVVGSLVTATAAVTLLATGIAGFAKVNDMTEPSYALEEQHCELDGRITYCANPGYQPFIAYWRSITDGVLAQVPPEVAARTGTVRQVLDRHHAAEHAVAGSVIADPGLQWGKAAGKGVAELILALDVAAWALDIESFDVATGCAADEQARAIVQMWLAGQVSPEARALASDLGPFADSITGSEFGEALHAGPRAGRYARQLLARPDDEVGRTVRAAWGRLVDPKTSDDDAQNVLGIEPVSLGFAERGERSDVTESGGSARSCR